MESLEFLLRFSHDREGRFEQINCDTLELPLEQHRIMSKERRKHPRIDFGHGGEALVRQRLDIELTDLSVGGMGFKANIPMEPDSICDLVLFNGNLSIESHIASCVQVDQRSILRQ